MTRLKDLLPEFSPNGLDSKLYHIAIEDFYNYLKVKWNIHSDVEVTSDDIKEAFIWWVNKYSDAKEEVDVWISLWLKKWKERTMVLFGNEEVHNRNFNQIQELPNKPLGIGLQESKMYKNPVIFALINNGEIVATEMIANTIIARAYSTYKTAFKGDREKLQFLNKCMKDARAMSFVTGKLVFISVKDFDWKVMF